MNRSMIAPGALTVVGASLGVWGRIWPLAVPAVVIGAIGVALEARGAAATERPELAEALRSPYLAEIESRTEFRSSGD